MASRIGGRAVGDVEPQVRLTLFLVESVTGKAVIRENRPDVTIETDLLTKGRDDKNRKNACDSKS